MMLIPRHERWPVLTSTQGYLIRNMHFINSRIRRYEMSPGMGDAVSEGLLLVDRGGQRSAFISLFRARKRLRVIAGFAAERGVG
jgi:hypothetical protein